jgi:hypothetical protein
MNTLINLLAKVLTRLGLLKQDLDYHLLRASDIPSGLSMRLRC